MPAGRPSKYRPDFHIPWARSLARRGLINEEIAQEMGVSKATLQNWEKKDPELLAAIKEGKSYADSIVEDSLYKRACGFKVTETKTILVPDETGVPRLSRIERVEKEIPPDNAAGIFWLKNRKPDIWRDKPRDDTSEDRPTINITIPAKKVENG